MKHIEIGDNLAIVLIFLAALACFAYMGHLGLLK
jgi:hypothetical protein